MGFMYAQLPSGAAIFSFSARNLGVHTRGSWSRRGFIPGGFMGFTYQLMHVVGVHASPVAQRIPPKFPLLGEAQDCTIGSM